MKNMWCKSEMLCVFLVGLVNSANVAKNRADVIGFPEPEEDDRLRNKEDRMPVYIPSTCPVNELYYPGDQADDWICDCRPAYLYHPASDKCWPAYKQGPCGEGFYLTLPKDSVIPTCEKNPCHIDSYVYWKPNNRCNLIGSPDPCRGIFPAAAFGVNATTLEIGCVRLSLETRFGFGETPVVAVCPPGAKRSVNHKCGAGAVKGRASEVVYPTKSGIKH